MIEDKTPHRTQLSDLGEFGLIAHLTADCATETLGL